MAYATALRLRAAGAAPSLIADALGIDPEGLGPLLALAEAKLGHLLDGDEQLAGHGPEASPGDLTYG